MGGSREETNERKTDEENSEGYDKDTNRHPLPLKKGVGEADEFQTLVNQHSLKQIIKTIDSDLFSRLSIDYDYRLKTSNPHLHRFPQNKLLKLID